MGLQRALCSLLTLFTLNSVPAPAFARPSLGLESRPATSTPEAKNSAAQHLEAWAPHCRHPRGDEGSAAPPPARYDYCTCTAEQEALFSSARAQRTFENNFGSDRKDRAKLLMLAAEGEQLSKGRQHLAEAMALAKEFERTMVLPNVGGSVIAVDRAMHPCAYFDTAKIGNFVDWVSQQAVIHNLHRLSGNATATVFVLGENNGWAKSFLTLEKLESLGPQLEALVSSADVHVIKQWDNYKEQMQVALKEAENSDLVVLIKSGDGVFIDNERFQTALQQVEYAPHLLDIAEKAVKDITNIPNTSAFNSLGQETTLLATQLRMEKFLRSSEPPFERCMEETLRSIGDKRTRNNVTHTFLAADVSSQGHFYSASFLGMPPKARVMGMEGIKRITEVLRPTTWADLDPTFINLDSGIQGILDKMVCVYAQHFMLPPECSKLSSYTLEIIQRRQALFSK